MNLKKIYHTKTIFEITLTERPPGKRNEYRMKRHYRVSLASAVIALISNSNNKQTPKPSELNFQVIQIRLEMLDISGA